MQKIEAEDLALEVGELSKVFLDFEAKGLAQSQRERIPGRLVKDAELRILVVDDDPQMRRACHQLLKAKGARVSSAGTLSEAELRLRKQDIDLLLLDLKLPDGLGLTLLERTKVLCPDTAVVVMTAFATVSSAIEAMRIGARDYLTKPFSLSQLTTVVERAGQRAQFDRQSRLLREKLSSQTEYNVLIGNSSEMEKLHRLISRVTFSTHPVLILGESGTGKGAVARAIHFNGPHAAKPFVSIDCAAIAQESIEAELFGQTQPNDVGVAVVKPGLLGNPEGGTVFLDEIGELSIEIQAKLVRALQDKEIRIAGSTAPLSVRVLAATNRDLTVMVDQGKFRKDLFFRLNVVNVRIPPLRERRGDIPLLATQFLARAEGSSDLSRSLSDDALHAMLTYEWPGNIRELASSIEHACALSEGPVLHLACMPLPLQEIGLLRTSQKQVCSDLKNSEQCMKNERTVNDTEIVTISEMEKRAILRTIRKLNGDKLLAAKLLGIGKTTLYRKLREYGIEELIGNTRTQLARSEISLPN
jgi:two-component system response regulator HydG